MAERKVTIAIDIVQSGNGKAKVKSVISDVEREVKASQKRIADNAKQVNRIIEDSDKAQARIKKTLARQQADDFIRELRRVEHERKRIEQQAKSSGAGFGSILGGSFLGNIGANAVSTLTSQLTSAGRAVFEFSSKMEQTKIGFATLMKNAALSAGHIRELQKLSTDFPLDFEALAKISGRLQGARIEASKIVPLLKDIGNIAAATGDLSAERIEGIGIALSQIASKTKVSAEEMEQLAERGVPAWLILSEAIGKTQLETRKMAEEGEITAKQLFDAFQKFSRMNYGDAMKRQAGTFSGAMMQIKNILLQTANTAFEPFYKKVSGLAVETAKRVKEQKDDFAKIGSTIGTAMGEAAGYSFAEAIKWTIKDLGKGGALGGYLNQDKKDTGVIPGTLGGFGASALGGLLSGPYGGIHSRLNRLGTHTGLWNPRTNRFEPVNPMGPLPGQYTTDYSRPGPRPPARPEDSGESSLKDLNGISALLNAMRGATMGQESGGNARARNGRTDASGLFQVMPANIGPWTKSALGQSMSQNDFLSSPRAQEAVFNHVMGQYLATAMKLSGGNKEVAVRMAAAAWYGGEGAMKRYDDPTKFRANEPSFREYTTSVLNRTKLNKIDGREISFDDVQKELTDKMGERSDIATENSKRILAMKALEIYKESGILPSKEFVDTLKRMMTEDARRQGIAQPSDAVMEGRIFSQGKPLVINPNEPDFPDSLPGRNIEANKVLQTLYQEQADALINLIEPTEKQLFLHKVAMGQYPELNEATVKQIAQTYELIDARKKEVDEAKKLKDEQEAFDKRVISEIENLKREEYQKTRGMIEESLDYLSRGDLKGLAQSMIERNRRALVEKGTDFIMDALGLENPDDTPELKEAKKHTKLLGQIAMGVGAPGIPGLSTVLNGGGGGQGGLGSILGGLFGGGGGAGAAGSAAGGAMGGAIPGLGGSGGGGMWGGWNDIKKMIPGLGGAGGSGISGMLRGMGGGSMMAGLGSGIGAIGSMIGGAVGGKWGNMISLAGMGAQIGAMAGPWGAVIGGAIGAGAGLLSMLFNKDNAEKKLKEAALSTYGITVKDKDVLRALKTLGESMFGKGKVGANAQAVVSSDQGQNILRNYAEATGQSTKMIDRLYYGDENWSGNQFRGTFSGFGGQSLGTAKMGGFRAMGGHVSRGFSYVVGERGAEVFTPSTSGRVSTMGGGGHQMQVILGTLEESINMLATKLNSMSPGHVLAMGAAENPNVIGDAAGEQLATRQDLNDQIARGSGRAF